jgi:hypothetical protein
VAPDGNKLNTRHDKFSKHYSGRRDGSAPTIFKEVQSKKHSYLDTMV